MPYLPGGSSQQLEVLRKVLGIVKSNDGLLTTRVDLGDGQERTLRDVVKQIAPAGLVQHLDRQHVAVSDDANRWLESGDGALLVAIFHRHVRYIGELLAELREGPLPIRALKEAAEAYALPWSTVDQTRRRITWFICLGLVEYRTQVLVALTSRGEEAALRLEMGGPTRRPMQLTGDVEVREPPPHLAGLLGKLTETALAARNSSLGYIPRGNGESDVVRSLQALLDASSPSTTRSELLAFAERTFNVSESSFGAIMTTLTQSHLLEQTALNIYAPTDVAREWLDTVDPLDLTRLLHSRYLFMLEIIPMLREFDNAPELARAAVAHFGMARLDLGGIRTRLQLLKAAGLIAERANWRYEATPLGIKVAETLPLQQPIEPLGTAIPSTTPGVGSGGLDVRINEAMMLGRELVEAATASDTPVRLEQAVVEAMTFLGFEARHVGGGGKTDVIATVEGDQFKSVRIILDAKSARSGAVAEGAVSFDTLREHRVQHKADYAVLVGPGFDAGRVRARAEKNGIALITTEELADTLMRHARSPISTKALLGLLDEGADARRKLEAHWTASERRVELLGHVVGVLAEEARDADTVTNGALTGDQIYLIVRGQLDPRPSPKDIEGIIELLQHPLIASVEIIVGERGRQNACRLIDSPALVKAKISALARVLDGLVEGGS